MPKVDSATLGKEPISKLLIKQSVPASIGILVMSLNILVDTIFVGNWIGPIGIAAINVVLPISFFIAALGMAIGIGGSSIISRALGANNNEKALKTFGNQITLTILLTVSFVIVGLWFINDLIPAFGGKGEIFEPAKIYYKVVLYGVPILALSMMGNNVIRAEGKPNFAMIAMIIPSVGNLIADYFLINVFDMGMLGAAWATTGSYMVCFLYVLWFFLSKNSELRISLHHFGLNKKILGEIGALGFVTLARQAVVSLTYLLMNNILFKLGGESSVAVYAIIGRMLMFALFPVLGVTQGFLPIAGYNHGAGNPHRVRESINKAILYASILALFVFAIIMIFPKEIVSVFTQDKTILKETPGAMRWVFAAIPIIALQLIGSAYFQAIGKALPALLLTLTRQGFFFIPLILILPKYFGEFGVWISFPLADVISTIVTGFFLNREIRHHLKPEEMEEQASPQKF
ncbi:MULTISPECIES: MATE family efflux transporter [Mesonia]|uniref:Multidrug export protein MepA n=1 Tax=Mesonia oceanica TaxID=2687242 RepID=A0AC61Y376_9FLAO|nr:MULTISPECIES: MATE family efflux transporter [Mesonia]MAN28664.1 MATE family efflux transporter [Mesonia sp.]MAQ41345.1 MATE family efflux transporter [Mesonia sp.]MBJ97444.1 MATE family efflux transporter [Flavobacteriaceae bacterium]VVU98918.1 Multidrug export protein MepA [Mesonia oceanica]|tara:strand:- start:14162 stop:15541 length:1380 start_codon:yes stop_codon:yes gene_type:complete